MADADMGRALTEDDHVRICLPVGGDGLEPKVPVIGRKSEPNSQGAQAAQPSYGRILARTGHIPVIGSSEPRLSAKSGLYCRLAVRPSPVQIDQNVPRFGALARTDNPPVFQFIHN